MVFSNLNLIVVNDMIVSVSSEGRKLVASGVFNSAFVSGNEVTFNFNYLGLRIKLVILLFIDPPSNQPPIQMPEFTIGVEEEVVVMRQPYKFSELIGIDKGYCGMLVPFEMGVKSDNKKIYMSWKIDVDKSVGGTMVAQLQYSLYEDE